jgi:hypothetical protein
MGLCQNWKGVAAIYHVPIFIRKIIRDSDVILDAVPASVTGIWSGSGLMLIADNEASIQAAAEKVNDLMEKLRAAHETRKSMALLKE